MKNRDRSRLRLRAGRAAGVRLGLVVSAGLAFGACSSAPDAVSPAQEYQGAERAPAGDSQSGSDASTASAAANAPVYTPPEIAGRDQPFPNLGEGPQRPVVRTPAETSQLTEGLIADRTRSRHASRGIPLQGMSGERRSALSAMADGGSSFDSEAPAVAAGSSSPEVIRARLGPAAPTSAQDAAQGPGPRGGQPVAATAGRVGPSTDVARAPGGAAAARGPGAARGTSSPVAFSDTPPPSGPTVSTSAPPPPPRFADVAPPTLGLTSAPPRQQPEPVAPASASIDDLPPPPPPGPASPALSEAAPAADVGSMARDDVAALGEATEPPSSSPRSEKVATVRFERETELGESERAILREVAALHQQRGGRIRVVGHHSAKDGSGSVEDGTRNEQASLARANAVAQELVRLGVDRQEISTAAGSGAPAAGEVDVTGTEIYFTY